MTLRARAARAWRSASGSSSGATPRDSATRPYRSIRLTRSPSRSRWRRHHSKISSGFTKGYSALHVVISNTDSLGEQISRARYAATSLSGVNDYDRAVGRVRDRIRHAAEDPAHPLHASISHHDGVRVHLVGKIHDDLGGLALDHVQYRVDAEFLRDE